MSKAHDPDRSAALWYSAGRSSAEVDAAPADSQTPATAVGDETREISVEIWLFGLLSTMSAERPVKLTLPAQSTTEDVLASLGERIGWECLEQVKDGKGGLLPHCRVIVNDIAIEDVAAPIASDARAATIEMILLKGFEGG